MKNKSGSLDTNVILRLLLRDDEPQYQLAKKLINSKNMNLHIADISLAEVAFVLGRYYQLSREDIKLTLEALVFIDNLNFNRPLLLQSLEYFIQHSKLSLEDCMLSAYAKLNQAEPLYTFDKKLANQIDNAEHIG